MISSPSVPPWPISSRTVGFGEGRVLIGPGDTLGREIIARTNQSAQCPRLVRVRSQRAEAMAVGTQEIGQDEGIAGIALALSGAVAGARGLQGVGVDRDDGMACVQQGIYEQARRTF